ncbi:universal stress protein, partial [Aurantibacter sp.]|uniref:universal stress protein n=1 Tax=Aurantibacter sp. TaxID=2807103 RepID=UPI003266F542
MKNVLLPTDFSENALIAAKYATQLFDNEECKFYFLNVYTPSIVHSRFLAETKSKTLVSENESKLSKQGLQKALKEIKKLNFNKLHNYEAISSFDFLTQKIIETVESEKIDIIVSGTKGASGYKEVF